MFKPALFMIGIAAIFSAIHAAPMQSASFHLVGDVVACAGPSQSASFSEPVSVAGLQLSPGLSASFNYREMGGPLVVVPPNAAQCWAIYE